MASPGEVASSRIDAWAQRNPWHPRVIPWAAYIAILAVVLYAREWQSWTYVPLKMGQAAAVCYLVWRWRHLIPELTCRFHAGVFPLSVALTAAWIYLRGLMVWLFPGLAVMEPTYFQTLHDQNSALFWWAATAHLLAMCTAVPIIEETFHRSLLLRSLHDARQSGTGILQGMGDLPLLGDWLLRTERGRRAAAQPPVFGEQFERTPLGRLSIFGVAASTFLFMLVHAVPDWPAAVLCGVAWCVLLNRTRHRGLGPVVWSHAIVNLLLWAYVVTYGDWQFL
jgi:hypothetical protein